MEQIKITAFLERNKKMLFPNKEYTDIDIENALMSVDDSFESVIYSVPFKKPSTLQLISIIPGSLGVDRFYMGEYLKGFIKYITFGGAGVWWLIDVINAQNRCRVYNCKRLLEALNDPAAVAQMQNSDAKIKKAGEIAKVAAQAGKVAAKGLKDIGNTLDLDY